MFCCRSGSSRSRRRRCWNCTPLPLLIVPVAMALTLHHTVSVLALVFLVGTLGLLIRVLLCCCVVIVLASVCFLLRFALYLVLRFACVCFLFNRLSGMFDKWYLSIPAPVWKLSPWHRPKKSKSFFIIVGSGCLVLLARTFLLLAPRPLRGHQAMRQQKLNKKCNLEPWGHTDCYLQQTVA